MLLPGADAIILYTLTQMVFSRVRACTHDILREISLRVCKHAPYKKPQPPEHGNKGTVIFTTHQNDMIIHPAYNRRDMLGLMSGSKPSMLVHLRFLASHSTFSPLPLSATQTARLPSSTVSVKAPAYSGKFDLAGSPPLMARIHSS